MAPTNIDPLMRKTKAELVKMVRELSDAIGEAGSRETFAFSARVADVQRDGYGNHVVTLEVDAAADELAYHGVRDGERVLFTNEEVVDALRALEDIEDVEAAA